jgi:hypothetical protein
MEYLGQILLTLATSGALTSIILAVQKYMERNALRSKSTIIGVVGPCPKELISLPVFGSVKKARRSTSLMTMVFFTSVRSAWRHGADLCVCPPSAEAEGVIHSDDSLSLEALVVRTDASSDKCQPTEAPEVTN